MESSQGEVTRRYSKYVFLDVVKFSQRSAEAQSEIVARLNEIVRTSLPVPADELERSCIFIPTGDGMCIAFINLELPYDIHIQTALRILKALDKYNYETEDETRKFQIRIGINQNTDILVTDINSRLNVAGAGINMAARIMDKADGGQVLVSGTVYDELQPSEMYMDKFRPFHASGKHDIRFQVFQFIGEGHTGLNTDIPTDFAPKEESKPEPKLTKREAYYFANAIKNKDSLVRLKDEVRQIEHKAAVVYWIISLENEMTSIKGVLDRHDLWWELSEKPFAEQLKHLDDVDFNVLLEFSNLISRMLGRHGQCFIRRTVVDLNVLPNEKAEAKLKDEWPSIWDEFGFGRDDDGDKTED